MQGVLAALMHCAATVASFLNDEDAWQRAYTRYLGKPNTFIARSDWLLWLSISMFVVKSSAQWISSFAVIVDVIFTVSVIPLAVVTTLFLTIALLLEAMKERDRAVEVLLRSKTSTSWPALFVRTTWPESEIKMDWIQVV